MTLHSKPSFCECGNSRPKNQEGCNSCRAHESRFKAEQKTYATDFGPNSLHLSDITYPVGYFHTERHTGWQPDTNAEWHNLYETERGWSE